MYAVQSPRCQTREPNWRDYRRFTNELLAPAIRPWLLDTGSLTRRLIAASDNQFRVQLLRQCWDRPLPSEQRLLDLPPREMAIIREVALICAGQPWVYARSVMPARSLTGRLHQLRYFDNSSLGAMLFSDPAMHRRPFELAIIDGQCPQLPAHLRCNRALWGRRSRFELSAKPLMVSEIFLPAFRPLRGHAGEVYL